MNYLIRAAIQDLVAPENQIRCSSRLWHQGLVELKRRGMGRHESGAFLLGNREGAKRKVNHFIYYDDLDPHCLDSGIVRIDGSAFGKLWTICREAGLEVVADVHTHPGLPFQSRTDKQNPMIGVAGHIAIIVPNLAQRVVPVRELGIYEYRGNHKWRPYVGNEASKFFYIGLWS
jgi:proteasome lid subunit RPN8/RPN11